MSQSFQNGREMGVVTFADGKAPGAMRTIGEVAKALGIAPHVLRYWEQQFPMLSPLKRSGGRRYYRSEDVAIVAAIDRLVHREGYTLRGARLAIEGASAQDAAPVGSVAAIPTDSGNLTRQLVAIRNRLAAALAAG